MIQIVIIYDDDNCTLSFYGYLSHNLSLNNRKCYCHKSFEFLLSDQQKYGKYTPLKQLNLFNRHALVYLVPAIFRYSLDPGILLHTWF